MPNTFHATLAVIALWTAACDDGGKKAAIDAPVTPQTDAAIDAGIDAPPDAPPDAPIDAPPSEIEKACMAACDKIFTCAMVPPEPECYADCGADLADCTPQQVMDVEACGAADCGAMFPENSPLIMCLEAITCIDP
jgi:hypothetical protein